MLRAPFFNSIQRRADRAHDAAAVDSDLLASKETSFDSTEANIVPGPLLLDLSSTSMEAAPGVNAPAPSGNTGAVPTSLSASKPHRS